MSRERQWAKRAADPDAEPLRRAGWRLAALTVGLLCALLLALGSALYFKTNDVLLTSLQSTLQQSVNDAFPNRNGSGPPIFTLRAIAHACSRGRQGEVALTIALLNVNQNLSIVCPGTPPITGTSAFGANPSAAAPAPQLPDQTAAKQALHGQLASQFSIQPGAAGQPNMIFTMPIEQQDGTVVGVVQASLSEAQYLNSLHVLLQVLIGISALGLLASAAISGVLARYALQPIRAALQRQRDFVADAAHELRTPLTIMRTSAELSLSSGSMADQQVALEQTLAQNAHLTRLVDALSLLARADSGVVTLERQSVDLAHLVRETVDGVEILAEERDVRVQVNAPDGTRVTGDSGRLRQLLLILLDNALKFTPEGGAIAVSVERQSGRARLQVRDSGPGIDPRDLPHLFDRFYRADRARAGEGTGLGLAIGRWIAEAHGGSIAAANAPGRGALFTVTLPLAS